MAKPVIEMICENCGNKQEPDKEKSNENWNFYDCKEKCKKCGGKFKPNF